jgi:hypothetical protein
MRRNRIPSFVRNARLRFLWTAAVATCAFALQIGCGVGDTATSAPNPSNLGDSVTFTATLTSPGPAPTGTITFLDSGSALAPAIPISPGNPTTLAISTLSAGMHSVVANYSGDGTYGAASSPPVIQVVVAPADYFTVPSCRLVDTRGAAGAYGAPPLSANAERTFVAQGQCGIPSTARAISANLTVTGPTADGDLRIYTSGTPAPLASALNYRAGQTRGNNAEVTLGADGGFTVFTEQGSGTVHLIVDVNGYFQ